MPGNSADPDGAYYEYVIVRYINSNEGTGKTVNRHIAKDRFMQIEALS